MIKSDRMLALQAFRNSNSIFRRIFITFQSLHMMKASLP